MFLSSFKLNNVPLLLLAAQYHSKDKNYTVCHFTECAIPILLCNLALHYTAEWPHLPFTGCIINILNKASETPQQFWIHFQSGPINKNYLQIYLLVFVFTSSCTIRRVLIPELFLSVQKWWDCAACAECQTEFGHGYFMHLSPRATWVNVEQNCSTGKLPVQGSGWVN